MQSEQVVVAVYEFCLLNSAFIIAAAAASGQNGGILHSPRT
jgi:hypothetical protein